MFVLPLYLLAQPYELVSMNGPNGGMIGDIEIDSNGHIYAGAYSFGNVYYGLYKSTDNGDNWVQVVTPDEKIEIFAIYINNDGNIYLGTNFGGRIWRSTDNGSSWDNIRDGYDTAECWAIGESLNGIMFAGDGQYHKTYRSLDYGNNWEHIDDLAPTVFATDTNNNIYAGSLYWGLFGSTDLGDTWYQNDFLKNIPVTTMLIDSNNHFYCGTGYYDSGNGVYCSVDEGATWEHLGLDSTVILSLAFDSKHNLYAGSSKDGLFKTSDNGISWTQHKNGLFRKQVFRMKTNNQNDIFIGSEDEGIFRSTNGGKSFEQIGLPISRVENFVIAPNGNFYVATPSGVQEYNPQIEKWENLGLHGVEAIDINVSTGELYVATWADGVMRSIDYGNSWIETSLSTDSLLSIFNIKVLNDGSLLVATAFDLRRSTNNGETWQVLPIEMSFFTHSIYITPNGFIYLNGYQDNEYWLFVSFDNGDTFSKVVLLPGELDWTYLNSIVVNNNGDVFITSYLSTSGIYRKLNNETELVKIFDKPVPTLYIDKFDNIYAGTKDFVYLSKDNGETWHEEINSSLQNNYVTFMIKDSLNYLYVGAAGGSKGLLRTTLPTSIEDKHKRNIALSYSLKQNYPNPFNPSTIIRYEIGYLGYEAQHVKLSVYNLLGQTVAVLVNKEQKSGIYEIEFDASNLSGGVYFYTLKTDNYRETQKMILIR